MSVEIFSLNEATRGGAQCDGAGARRTQNIKFRASKIVGLTGYQVYFGAGDSERGVVSLAKSFRPTLNDNSTQLDAFGATWDFIQINSCTARIVAS